MSTPAKLKYPIAVLRLPAVKACTGLGRSTIYSRIASGEFPAPIRLGVRAVGWLDDEIQSWIADQVAASRNSADVLSVEPGEVQQ